MNLFPRRRSNSACLVICFALFGSTFAAKPSVELRVLGTHATGIFNGGAAEIVAHDPISQRYFVVNGAASSIDVLDAADPTDPAFLFAIDVEQYGDQANSVDVCGGIVAAAVQADVKTDNGVILFFDAAGNLLKSVPAGALPDMVTFTPNCDRVLAANEGEPNSYGQANSVDPVGSVTIVDLRNGVAKATTQQVDFTSFNGYPLPGVRVYGPGATVAQDLEPEYIAVDHNSKTAYVTLQENNAIAVIDIASGTVTAINALGFKDYRAGNNRLDASDRDDPLTSGGTGTGIFNVRNWPVFGMYQPDAISTIKYKNATFLITANEGDARAWPGFAEEARVSALTLDAAAFAPFDVSNSFPNGLRHEDNLGRLNVTRALGNTDADADYEALYTLGGRSFSIWTTGGELVFDSGDALEQLTYAVSPQFFNASNDDNTFDSRSDNKGPEPEAVTVGKAYGRTYAFVGLERAGGVVVFDVTNPYTPLFVQYINNRLFTQPIESSGDLGPEGIHFVAAEESPTGIPLLAVANEVSGTTTVYEFVQTK